MRSSYSCVLFICVFLDTIGSRKRFIAMLLPSFPCIIGDLWRSLTLIVLLPLQRCRYPVISCNVGLRQDDAERVGTMASQLSYATACVAARASTCQRAVRYLPPSTVATTRVQLSMPLHRSARPLSSRTDDVTNSVIYTYQREKYLPS